MVVSPGKIPSLFDDQIAGMVRLNIDLDICKYIHLNINSYLMIEEVADRPVDLIMRWHRLILDFISKRRISVFVRILSHRVPGYDESRVNRGSFERGDGHLR